MAETESDEGVVYTSRVFQKVGSKKKDGELALYWFTGQTRKKEGLQTKDTQIFYFEFEGSQILSQYRISKFGNFNLLLLNLLELG